jgi:predicted PhzF superfamily epimerase YddE/YHI9
LCGLDRFAVIATAPGTEGVDFVSRFFAPEAGVPEDPVTGSAHCTLIPYWAERLGRTKLAARQISRRGGELECELLGERVRMAGRAVLYLRGTITI